MSKKSGTEFNEGELKNLYEPDYFYDHGDNPALKDFLKRTQANVSEKSELPDYRAHVPFGGQRWTFTRTIDDMLERNLRITTLPRYALALYMTYVGFGKTFTWVQRHFPYGQNGITSMKQCQFYKIYGSIPSRVMIAIPFIAAVPAFQIASYCVRGLWNFAVYGERDWDLRTRKDTPSGGDYYFNDSPLASEETMPDVVRGAITLNPKDRPDWAQ